MDEHGCIRNLDGNVLNFKYFYPDKYDKTNSHLHKSYYCNMVFYMLQTMCSYYFKCYDLFNKEASKEGKDAEDNCLVSKMVTKLNISNKDFMLITEEIKNLKEQLEDPVEEAARREMRDLEAGAASLLNDLKKQQDCVKGKENYRNELRDKIAKLYSNNDVLKTRIKKVQADISRMKHVVSNHHHS
jgi:cell division protein FtsB